MDLLESAQVPNQTRQTGTLARTARCHLPYYHCWEVRTKKEAFDWVPAFGLIIEMTSFKLGDLCLTVPGHFHTCGTLDVHGGSCNISIISRQTTVELPINSSILTGAHQGETLKYPGTGLLVWSIIDR